MAFQGDPYRILGLAPGASLNEIRSAYRRLAKQFHPDAAGDRALPRFLAIQAAYERLVDAEGRLRAAPGRGRGTAARRPPATSDPWRADPARAQASREAWRARRAGQAPGSGARDDAAGARRRRREPRRDARGPGAAGERHGRRGPRKATPGSTTYDEATDVPRDPEWEGGSWYGPSSRTYWTINPREYADPRKHGPEYQARARRAAEQEAAAGTEAGWSGGTARTAGDAPVSDADAGDAAGDDARWQWTASESTTTDGGAAGWGAHGWSYAAEDEADAVAGTSARRRTRATGFADDARAGRAGDRRHRHDAWQATASDAEPLPDLEAVARRAAPLNLLALALRPDRRWRLVLALVGWPPIGYAVGMLLSTVTGCASYAATCPEPAPLLGMAVQPLVVAALFALPPAAAVAAFGSIVGLAVAVPVAAVLSVGTMPESRVGAPVLGVVVAVAYLVALVAGAIVVWRPRRAPPEGP